MIWDHTSHDTHNEMMNPLHSANVTKVISVEYFMIVFVHWLSTIFLQSQEYKPPCSKDIPIDFRVSLLKNAPNPLGILRSKGNIDVGLVEVDCLQSPIFPEIVDVDRWVRQAAILVSSDSSETWESTKCPWVGVVEGTAGEGKISAPLPPRF